MGRLLFVVLLPFVVLLKLVLLLLLAELLFSTSLFELLLLLLLLLYFARLETCVVSVVISELTARLLFNGFVLVGLCCGDELSDEDEDEDMDTEPVPPPPIWEQVDGSSFIPTSLEWSMLLDALWRVYGCEM
jgi:hypothetical protein